MLPQALPHLPRSFEPVVSSQWTVVCYVRNMCSFSMYLMQNHSSHVSTWPKNEAFILFFFFLKEFLYFFLIFIYFIILFILFLAVLGLRLCARAFPSCGKRGPLFIAVHGPLTIAASPVAEHRLQTRRLSSRGSWA